MYNPKHFELYEWLPKDFYHKYISEYGDKLWLMFDDRILWTYDKLRERYGRIVMNDWWWGGSNQYRGWRPFNCSTGAKLSQHKFARAGDGIFIRPAEEIRQDILKNEFDNDFQYISVIEKAVNWLHCDTRNHDNARYGILII
ncbi:peptidase M15 [candidate division WOR-3 bacterium]|nr:peptidase M15 [candidate division WOR-3 bacterium]